MWPSRASGSGKHSLLYQVLADHLETFLQQVRTSDHALPWYVERDLRAFLDCGVLAHGFLRLRCPQCNTSRVVPFSCCLQWEAISS